MTKRRGKETIQCEQCGKTFVAFISDKRRFCSMQCSAPHSSRQHGQSRTRLYDIWSHIKRRCLNPNSNTYKYYGKRRICVCDEWQDSFVTFQSWALSSGYEETLELDRIDVDGDYCPENCRWATRVEQMRNTRKRSNARTSKYKGVSWCANVRKWRTQIVSPNRPQHVGLFASEEEAARAYDEVAVQEFGEFANTNF